MRNKLINCKNVGSFLIAILMINLSLTVFAPLFFATYFTPFPTDEQIEEKIQTQKVELIHIFWCLLFASAIIAVLLFLFEFNGLEELSYSNIITTIVVFLMLIFTIYNTWIVYNFVKDSLAVNIPRGLGESINITDVVNVLVSRGNTTTNATVR